MRAYSIWEGPPGYVREIDPALGLWDAVARPFLDQMSRLFVEPDWLSFLPICGPIVCIDHFVRAMAMGKSTPGDIAKEVDGHSAADILIRSIGWSILASSHG